MSFRGENEWKPLLLPLSIFHMDLWNVVGLVENCDVNTQNTIWGSSKCNVRRNQLFEYILS